MIWPLLVGAAFIGSLSRRDDASARWLLLRAAMLTAAIVLAVAAAPAHVEPVGGAIARWYALLAAAPGSVVAPAGVPAVYLAYAVLLTRVPGVSRGLRTIVLSTAAGAALAIGGHSLADVAIALAIGEIAVNIPILPRARQGVGNPARMTGDPAPAGRVEVHR